MNQLPRSPRCHSLAIGFVMAIVSIGAVSTSAWAGQPHPPCTEEGAWQGAADNGFTWMNIITRGADATAGQLDLGWVIVDPTLNGAFAGASRVTPARGVWKKTSERNALWTWIAYGLDAAGAPAYVIRSSGTHHMPDCQRMEIAYTLEIFLPSQNMATDPPIAVLGGTALETRIPLVRLSGGQ